jgi:RNA polymerase sigma-70 factor (ECF subfamily)
MKKRRNQKQSRSLYTIEDKKRENTLKKDAIEGEASAFGELYDRYQPKIYRFIFLKVSHREEAEDLTHQVFLNAWKNVERYTDQGFPFSSWLFRIARNKVIDYYRTKKTTLDIDVIPEEIVGIAEQDSQQDAENTLQLEKVYRALQQLSEEQKEVLILRFIQELSYDEVAEIMDKSPGTVRVLQHRGIKRLQTLLKSNT